MIKGIAMLATAGALFLGAGSLNAQCVGHSHEAKAKHACATDGSKSCCAAKENGATLSELKGITLDELQTMLAASNVTVLDARDEAAYAAGHIDGAVLFAAAELPADKNATLVFYCGGLKCPAASKAAKKAVEQGYKNVMVFKGGWAEWNQSNS